MNWIDAAIDPHASALTIRGKRAEILATNIANSDTPGYKSRDMDFQAVFEQSKATGITALARTDSRHFAVSMADSTQTFYRDTGQKSDDGNTVEAEVEQSAFTENSMRYMASLSFLDGTIKTLTLALRGE